METTIRFSQYSPKTKYLLPPLPPKTLRRFRLTVAAEKRSSSSSSSSSSSDSSMPSLDESMIVLRKRIHQMKMIERSYEPPEEWARWEKQHYGEYDEHVCNFVGALQWILMNTRPSFAVAMIAVVGMSVPISGIAVALWLVQVANEVFSSLHLPSL